jgi:hypothetical protein
MVTDAVGEQVEEECEGVGSRALLGLIGVGVSGRRRLVTSPSGAAAAAAFRWRLTAAELGAGEPGGLGAAAAVVVVWGLIGIAAARVISRG